MDYFKEQADLLKMEWDEDRSQYLKLTETSSAADRRGSGITWYPVAIRDTELGRGDYLQVEVERTTHHDIAHQFRTGVPVALFSNHDAKNDRIEGTVVYQNNTRLKFTLNTDELPDWTRNGKLGIDLLFDDNTYQEMQKALKQAATIQGKPEGHLINVLTGNIAPAFTDEKLPIAFTNLNASQQAAVDKIISAKDLAIVHGPPGTGKTTTIVQAIKQLLQHGEKQLLVVAPSNTAVDLLSEKLSEQGLNVLRIGNPARVSERLMSLTLDHQTTQHKDSKEIKKLRKQAGEYKNMAHKYKRSFGKAERDQRNALFNEARKLVKAADDAEQFIIDDVIEKAQVITATLVGANHYTIRNLKFNTVVIDEAGQALEPACWIPIIKAQKVILAGDHCQLQPTIKSIQASRNGLGTTLFEKCVNLYPEAVILLEEQYRMHNQIMGYSSGVFYQDRLIAHPSVAEHLLFNEDRPLLFIDTAGCGFNEKQEGTSVTNPEEAVFLLKHLELMATQLGEHYPAAQFPSIAIIAPYKQQIYTINELISASTILQPYLKKISISTVDSFQGQERDMVYISMTRSNTDNEIGFLADIRRMNVAMTRAKKKLVIIGDSSTLSVLPFYANLIDYAEKMNAYQSAWEYAD
ncbi:AAA domain-containing protein [Mucilaginibacter gynuensis]|uniref:AAA domain-containing protein n=1 Tax=Mucilaginibacter gynuensis TaxID=1302236 RepID=A0ABP8H1Z1_9SPHI